MEFLAVIAAGVGLYFYNHQQKTATAAKAADPLNHAASLYVLPLSAQTNAVMGARLEEYNLGKRTQETIQKNLQQPNIRQLYINSKSAEDKQSLTSQLKYADTSYMFQQTGIFHTQRPREDHHGGPPSALLMQPGIKQMEYMTRGLRQEKQVFAPRVYPATNVSPAVEAAFSNQLLLAQHAQQNRLTTNTTQ